MQQVKGVIGLLGTVVAIIGALKGVGYLLKILAVFDEGLTAAANGGSIAPYIEALVLIMVVAAIPGWLLTVTDVDLA